jgi:hypothetical protein
MDIKARFTERISHYIYMCRYDSAAPFSQGLDDTVPNGHKLFARRLMKKKKKEKKKKKKKKGGKTRRAERERDANVTTNGT